MKELIEQEYQLRLHAKITEIPIVLHYVGRVRIYCKLKNRLNLLMSLQGEKKYLYFRMLKKYVLIKSVYLEGMKLHILSLLVLKKKNYNQYFLNCEDVKNISVMMHVRK